MKPVKPIIKSYGERRADSLTLLNKLGELFDIETQALLTKTPNPDNDAKLKSLREATGLSPSDLKQAIEFAKGQFPPYP